MTQDESHMLYEQYFELNNRTIVLTLKDKSVHKGCFMGFFKGDQEWHEPYIIKWRFRPECTQEHDFFVLQKNIHSILFLENNKHLNFK